MSGLLSVPTCQGISRQGSETRTAVNPLEAGRQPFSVDPAAMERGLKGHADTQNALARVLQEAGISPRSPLPYEPNFDLAWAAGGMVFVAEVKSITEAKKNSSGWA